MIYRIRNLAAFLGVLSSVFVMGVFGQTLFVPSGTVGASSNGNVGIGTTNPSVSLDVGGATSAMLGSLSNATTFTGYSGPYWGGIVLGAGVTGNSPFVAASRNGTGTPLPLRLSTADTTRVLISTTGNVGIGTTNPSVRLDVGGATSAMLGSLSNATTFTGYSGTYWGGIVLGAGINGNSPFVAASRNGAGNALPLRLSTADTTRVLISPTGNVGIGTTDPTNKLEVNGTIRAKEVIVEANNWPDYVFAKGAAGPDLMSWKRYIVKNGHLPGVPSKTQAEASGVGVGQMQKILLKKIEEMSLAMIKLQEENTALKARLSAVETKVNAEKTE